MRSISDTIARLAAGNPLNGTEYGAAGEDRLGELPVFGPNPGGLRARTYIPPTLRPGAPLVVVLHGCTQTAAGYDRGSGWSRLADRHGFALLFPEQQRANNANLCFNWFVPGDTARGGGEPLSIRTMVARMVADHALDPGRLFVTGLSAGGAMAAVMLATYPDVFAGGAVIAGLPFGAAATMPEAFDRMRGHGGPTRAELAVRARSAAGHAGRWPILSIWHGTADQTVAQGNADAIAAQWRDLHGLPDRPARTGRIGPHTHRLWHDTAGRAVVEEYRIAGMGHGTPIDPGAGADHGASGPFMLDVGIASSHRILRFWGLETDAPEMAAEAETSSDVHTRQPSRPLPSFTIPDFGDPGTSMGDIIKNALKTAGLVK